MRYPPFLQTGDKISIVSAAGKISRNVVERGAAILSEEGFVPLIGVNALTEYNSFAGTDAQRASDLQFALDHPEIKAIFFSRGGYGSIRTFQLLDWKNFIKNPKWLIGFSDITVFHLFAIKNKIASVHGVMPAFFEQDGEKTESFKLLIDLLKGQLPEYHIQPHYLNRFGKAENTLVGGNLTIIQSLRGTNLDFNPKGKILFIEDIGEYYYHLDRMMMNLKTGKVLENICGLIVGYFTDMKDGETPFGKSTYEIIMEAVEPYNFPVVFGFPAGHELPDFPLLMGGKVVLEVAEDGVKFQTKV
jgi:muramoyltetrapeptide carboxypeptidase